MQKTVTSWSQTLNSYMDKRFLWIFMMGCASGFPWVLIGSSMSGWLADAGLTRSAIGFFGSVFAVYAINFLWAPLVDRVKLPVLFSALGQRRSWILFTQVIMLAATIAIAHTDPAQNIMLTSMLALLIATSSATQDIAIDAFRIDSFGEEEKNKMPQASAMTVIGWWTGYSLPGYFAFTNADSLGWNTVYYGMAGVILLLMFFTFLIKEPVTERNKLQNAAQDRHARFLGGQKQGKWVAVVSWISVTVLEPFLDFFRRNGTRFAISILLFVFLFKIGEAFLGRMSIVFYKEVGFSNAQIGHYSKLIGWGATTIFTLIGSAINVRFGIVKGLLIGGIAMAGSNLMFAWLANVGPNEYILLAAIITDNFTSAFGTVAFVSFLTYLTGRAFSATQYALLASLGNLGRTTIASFSGVLVEWLGNWSTFFIVTTLMVIPSLLILLYMRAEFSKLHD